MTDYWTLTKFGDRRIFKKLMAGQIPWRVKMGRYQDGRLRKPDNIDFVHTGDKFLVYFTDGTRAFYGVGILSGMRIVKDSYYLDFQTRSGEKGIEEFREPEKYEALKNQLEWKPKMGSIRQISEVDFEIVMSSARASSGGPQDKTRTARDSEREVLRRKYGLGGEGREHKALKEWVKNHPASLGVGRIMQAETEHTFPSGDAADILFTLPNARYVVIEVETSNPLPGAYQALKYRTLKCAECRISLASSKVTAVLVAYELGKDVMKLCSQYGIRCVKISEEDVQGNYQK